MIQNTSRKLEQTVLIVGAAAIAIGSFLVIKPFIAAILWALILALVTWPIYIWLCQHLKNRRQLAALILVTTYCLIMVVPLVLIAWSLADNVKGLFEDTMVLVNNGLPPPPRWIDDIPLAGKWLHSRWQEVAGSRPQLLSLAKTVIVSSRDILLAGTAYTSQAIFSIVLSIFLSFFIYRDGEKFFTRIQTVVAKVAGEKSKKLLLVAGSTLRSVVYGLIGTAIAQGLLAGLGFLMFGVPNAALLSLAVFFLSLVPAGPPLVWGGAAVWLFYTGQTWTGIFMILWGVLVVSSVDNFLKPYIISKGSKMPLALVLLGVMGGALAFGVLGIFLGPTLLAIANTVFKVWSEDEPS